ncbi:MFS transporter [Rugosimonospora africana]|uniref:MFS transporter n=1 Tax=Rugosimonospora africana TaxID=556532 RepID=UPI001EF379EC|nr:MFS transporter [Rugosimonospora africana]
MATGVIGRPALWRQRDFLLLWGGQTVSEIGSQVTVLAMPLVAVIVLRASALQVGLLSAAQTAAYLLVSLPAGAVVERLGKRRVMVRCDLGRLVVIGSVPLAAAAGALTFVQLYAVAALSSVLSVFFSVAYPAYLPTLLEREQLMDGNGKLGTSQSVAQVGGPGLGAALVGLFGAAAAMAADAVSFLASAGGLLAIRATEPPAAKTAAGPGARPGLQAQIRDGLSYVLREPILLRGMLWSGSANFFVVMVESLGPLFLVRDLHLTAGYVGLLLGLGGIGGVAGGLTAGRLARRVGSARVCWLSMTVFSLPGLLIPAAGPDVRVLLFAIGWISWTFSATVCAVALLSYRQATCPPELLARVSASSRWITWGTLPLGGVVGGALGTALGVRPTLWIAVIGGCASGLWLFFSPLRGMRDIPVAAPAAGSLAAAS